MLDSDEASGSGYIVWELFEGEVLHDSSCAGEVAAKGWEPLRGWSLWKIELNRNGGGVVALEVVPEVKKGTSGTVEPVIAVPMMEGSVGEGHF